MLVRITVMPGDVPFTHYTCTPVRACV